MSKPKLYAVIGTDDFKMMHEFFKNICDLTPMQYISRGERMNTFVPLVSDMTHEYAGIYIDDEIEYHVEFFGSLCETTTDDLRSMFRPYMNENGDDIVFGHIFFREPKKLSNDDFSFYQTYQIDQPLSMVEARNVFNGILVSMRFNSIFQQDK